MKPAPKDSATRVLTPIGVVRSSLKTREQAPRQGNEGAPEARVEVTSKYGKGLKGIEAGQEIIVITWLHLSDRRLLQGHPRWDKNLPVAGVFSTRSPDRPNPLGLHRVRVLEISAGRLKVAPLEAIDGTPVVDIKPVLDDSEDS